MSESSTAIELPMSSNKYICHYVRIRIRAKRQLNAPLRVRCCISRVEMSVEGPERANDLLKEFGIRLFALPGCECIGTSLLDTGALSMCPSPRKILKLDVESLNTGVQGNPGWREP